MSTSSASAVKTRAPLLGPFVDLPEGPREALLAASRGRRFAANQIVFNRGEPANEVMILQSGLVAVHAPRPDGRRLTLELCGRDDVLGELALAGMPRRTAAVVALRETQVLAIDVREIASLRANTQEFDRAVMGVMADTIRRLTDQVLEMTLLSQAARLRRVLTRLLPHFPDGRIEITQELLAELLAAPRTTVTELLTAEAATGRIAKGRGYVRVLDPAGLRDAANERFVS